MKKLFYPIAALALSAQISQAAPVSPATAGTAALHFYNSNSNKQAGSVYLVYTAHTAAGDAAYYAFNVNAGDGFVIMAADDAAHPIIGYATEGNFVVPQPKHALYHWLQKRVLEVAAINTAHAEPTEAIAKEWAQYLDNKASGKKTAGIASVSPLVQTTWDQEPYYNALCPSGSVTGCVATAMAQIMRYWNYPAQGTGASSYCDCSSGGFTNNYGTLSANYGTTSFNWSNMPLHLNGNNPDVANLMYQCGVSVEMDYDPNGSGAWVIWADDSISAQRSYVNYFGYNPYTIQGLQRVYYDEATWTQILKNDIDAGRPIQYVGDDALQGGHTWVCDGYDQNGLFHMNWGWGGYGNGYFGIDYLNVGGYNPIEYEEALIGIQPPTNGTDIGVASIGAPLGNSCATSFTPQITLQNFGSTVLTDCVINYQLDNGAAQTQAWSGSLGIYQSVTVSLAPVAAAAGTHSFTCFTSNPNSCADSHTANDQYAVTFNNAVTGAALPLQEGFEASPALPAGWAFGNPDNDASWQVMTTVGRTGNNSIAFNNCYSGGAAYPEDLYGKKDRFYTGSYDFTGTNIPQLSFDVAYAPYDDGTQVLADTLSVYYSTDCGNNWSLCYQKGGYTLATDAGFNPNWDVDGGACWWPTTPSQWRNEFFSLSALTGSSNVMFAFENTSGSGGWLLLDNINILSNTTGIESYDAGAGFNVYPNPAIDIFTIEGFDRKGRVQYSITNMAGQQVKSGPVSTNGNGFKETVPVSELPSGIYFVKVSDDQHVWMKKLRVF